MKKFLWSSLSLTAAILVGVLWVNIKEHSTERISRDSVGELAGEGALHSEADEGKELAQQATTDHQPFGLVAAGGQMDLGNIPVGKFRQQLSRLGLAARTRALKQIADSPIPLNDFASIRASSDGALFYVCDIPMPVVGGPLQKRFNSAQESAGSDSSGTKVVAAAATSTPPVRHSRAGASKVIFLDFDGATISGTLWNTDYNSGAAFTTLAYSMDGDYASFSDVEQGVIIRTWERVAEDFRPFDVDVTTEAPATFGANVVHVLITRSTRADGAANPEAADAGGVAFLNNFGSAYGAAYSPAFVYHDHTSEETGMADAISHEAGHYIGGLHHDGTNSASYYQGHGTGGNLMGPYHGCRLW